MPGSSFQQRVRDAKANYQVVKLLREAATEAADAATTAEQIYTSLGGSLPPEEHDQIQNDDGVATKWSYDSNLPPKPRPGITARERADEDIQWEKLGKALTRMLRDYYQNGVGRAVQRLIKEAERLRRLIEQQRGTPNVSPNNVIAVGNTAGGGRNAHSGLPDPHNTGLNNPFTHGARVGFNLGGMKGGGGSLGSGPGSYGGGQGGQSGQAVGNGYGTGYGGGGGLGHDKADPGGSGSSDKASGPSPGDKPGSGPADGGGGGNSDVTFGADVITGTGADTGNPQPATPGGNATGTGTDQGTAPNDPPSSGESPTQSPTEAPAPPVDDPPPTSGDDPKKSGDPNPDDGTDDSGRMHGLSRYVEPRANRFTGKGAVPAQTSLFYRLLAFSSAGLGEDGGGVNPRFFGADPDSGRSTGRGGRRVSDDPDSGDGDGGGVGPSTAGGGDDVGGPPGAGGSDSTGGGPAGSGGNDGDGVAITVPSGPDPDNEWGAGGYNPHYQPSGGYVWTPYSRSGVGTTRVAPALTTRVQRVATIRFK